MSNAPIKRGIDAELKSLRERTQRVEAILLQEALEKKNLRGLNRLNLKALVKQVGVKGAAFRARYFNNVIRESTTPGLLEWMLALWTRRSTEESFRKKGWLKD